MWRRRQREQQRVWLDGWEAIAARRLRQWPLLTSDERARLADDVDWMVRTKHWEAARGFSLGQEIVVTIAAQASLLLLGLDRDVFRDVRAVVVHPRTIVQRGIRSTTVRGVVTDAPRRVLGHTLDRQGPVVLSWDAIEREAAQPGERQSVVLHEFAHKIDARDGLFDGTPQLGARAQLAEWVEVCTAEYDLLRHRLEPDPVLRDYAAETPSEFFAVATEALFEDAVSLREHKPALYRVLSAFYGQDTAARVPRLA